MRTTSMPVRRNHAAVRPPRWHVARITCCSSPGLSTKRCQLGIAGNLFDSPECGPEKFQLKARSSSRMPSWVFPNTAAPFSRRSRASQACARRPSACGRTGPGMFRDDGATFASTTNSHKHKWARPVWIGPTSLRRKCVGGQSTFPNRTMPP